MDLSVPKCIFSIHGIMRGKRRKPSLANLSEEIHEVSCIISGVCFVRVDVAARLPKLFRTPLPPPKGAAGSMRGWLKGKLLSHDHVRILGQPPKTQLAQSIQSRRGNNASCFLHFIYFQTLQWFCRTGLFLPQRPPWQTVNCYLKEVQPTLPKVNFGRKFFSSCPVFINIEAFHSLHIRFRNKCRRVLDGFFFFRSRRIR